MDYSKMRMLSVPTALPEDLSPEQKVLVDEAMKAEYRRGYMDGAIYDESRTTQTEK